MNEEQKLEVYKYIKYAVGVISLTKMLVPFDIVKQKEDLIQDLWVMFVEEKKYVMWDSHAGRNLKSFVKAFVLNKIMDMIKKLCRYEIRDGERITVPKYIFRQLSEYTTDDSLNPEEVLLIRELVQSIESFNYGGEENRCVVWGENQNSIAKEAGVTKQTINKKVKRQRQKLRLLLNGRNKQ